MTLTRHNSEVLPLMPDSHRRVAGATGTLAVRAMVVATLLAAALPLGCSARSESVRVMPSRTTTTRPAAEHRGEPTGTIVMIPGIVGQPSDLFGMRDGLCDAMAAGGAEWYEIEIIPWETSAFQPIKNLTDYEANVARARKIAARLTQLHRERPGRPLVLLGNSGGGGLAILAAEMLPAEVVLDRLVLTAAAVSNDYDLSRVEPHVKTIVNFYSPRDGIVGWGTSVFGTIDRKKTLSAGHCGFLTADGKMRAGDKLRQHEWTPEWRELGHDGSHLGYRNRKWAATVLAPHVHVVPVRSMDAQVQTAGAY